MWQLNSFETVFLETGHPVQTLLGRGTDNVTAQSWLFLKAKYQGVIADLV